MENRERTLRQLEDVGPLEGQGAPAVSPLIPPETPARHAVRLTPLPSAFERRNGAGAGGALVRVKSYEELDGGEGRGVFFRPHRHSAADLAPLSCRVVVSVGAVDYECPLWDVSQNGAALVWPGDLAVQPRERLRVALRFDDHEPFRGEAEVGSVRQQDGATVVGISFQDFLLDIDEILELRNVQSWSRGASAARLERRPWALPGCERYKSLLAELRLYYEDARREIDTLEATLPWHVLHGEDNAARTKLLEHLRGSFVDDAVKLTEAVDGAVRAIPGAFANAVAKEWSRRHVHEFIMMSPCCHRALNKPFGYPGDYEVMNFIYERNFEGADLFARTVQLGFAFVRSSKAVRGRKDFVKEQLQALVRERARSGRPVRVLSIAAGPAQELAELFSELREPPPVPVEIVLFEQDKNALAHAWRRLSPVVDARFSGAVRLTFLHDSIKRLLRDPDLFRQFGKFDLVYSCGLYDYLHQRTAVGLTRQLAATLAPEGRLLVANMVDNASRWLLEFHLDWPLVYRTRDELREIAQRADPKAQVRILEEWSGTNPFFELTRA